MKERLGEFILAMALGLFLALCLFLVKGDILHQQCENNLIKEGVKRSKVCDVKLRAIVINKGDKE